MNKAIFGMGGHAMEVADFIEGEVLFFTDENIKYFNPEKYEMLICIGDSTKRRKIVEKLPKNTKFFTFIHPTAIISKSSVIGEGSFIGAYSIITNNVIIGKHTIINRLNSIGHNTVCGNYLSMMPGSIISGDCKIGDEVYIGTNSSIREKIKICNSTIIGLNTGIFKNIEKSGIYVGNPLRILENKQWVNNPDGSISYVQ